MSGIVGVLNLRGAPVDRDLLAEMTACMAFRGPDARQIWINGQVGFGHTLLRTTHESDREKQPFSLEGQVWITADARVDARTELIRKLESAGRQQAAQATDPELILHAYHVWGESCPRHLVGDFAFGIWDGPRRLAFCARDHFGIKPFYYAQAGKTLLFSNTLNCLRLHPEISDDLNDLAIADLLLFDCNQDPATTSFAGIQRLPPGHYLLCTEESLQIQSYWTLAPGPEIRYRRAGDYLDHFNELFREAVKDRIRTNRVAVFMSGGLDSTLVAAVAANVMGKQPDGFGPRAYTLVFDRLIADQERKYSQLAADFIPIPIDHLAVDNYRPYAAGPSSRPEPENNALQEMETDRYRQVAAYARAVLTGDGADPALHTNGGYIADFLRIRAWPDLIRGIGWCLRVGHRFPRLGFRTFLKGGSPPFCPPFPRWLNPDLIERLDIPTRWKRLNGGPKLSSDARSEARNLLQAPSWQSLFEHQDPGVTQFTIEHRHPFFDLRLITFLASLPPLPWCQEKNLLKAAGKGKLPNSVRLRQKTPLAGDPLWEYLRNQGPGWWIQYLQPVPELSRYVNLEAVGLTSTSREDLWTSLRVVGLNYWLQSGRKSRRIKWNSGGS